MLFPFRGVRGKGQGVVELGVRRVSGRGRDREDGWHGGDRVRRAHGCQRARGARGAPGREGSSQRQTSNRRAVSAAGERLGEGARRGARAARRAGRREVRGQRRRRRWHRAPQDPAILRRGSLRARPGAPLPVPGALAHRPRRDPGARVSGGRRGSPVVARQEALRPRQKIRKHPKGIARGAVQVPEGHAVRAGGAPGGGEAGVAPRQASRSAPAHPG